ncbi:hypothetical protein G7046_g8164 [Stylonectria norvegica]|nr:hypothetical protein G7046_g8164 [Stylonectria norvegica]
MATPKSASEADSDSSFSEELKSGCNGLQHDSWAPSSKEAMCSRTSFFVNVDWHWGAKLKQVTNIVGQMYVERLDPITQMHPFPIVLIHGDFHTGQVWMTKPDGNPGWASYFLNQGYQVYVVDLPPSGRSNFLTGRHFDKRKFKPSVITASFVERELTAPGKKSLTQPSRAARYPRALQHDKWPGTGQRDDPIFKNYCASLVTLFLERTERQRLAQEALQRLLSKTGKAILIGEGSGSNMAWLANDIEPDLVAAVVAVEPAGPPFGTAKNDNGAYTQFIKRVEDHFSYGLSDIPLTFDPPARPPPALNNHKEEPLDIANVIRPDCCGSCVLQRHTDNEIIEVGIDGKPLPRNKQLGRVRELVNLKKVPHALVTAEASPHIVYDWATVAFMQQAGVGTQWIRLEDYNIRGNGHLMFLETNSDDIAALIDTWIREKTEPQPMPKTALLDIKAEFGLKNEALLDDLPLATPEWAVIGDQSEESSPSSNVAHAGSSDESISQTSSAFSSSSSQGTQPQLRGRKRAPPPHEPWQRDENVRRKLSGPGIHQKSKSGTFPVPQLTQSQHLRAFQNLQGQSHGRGYSKPNLTRQFQMGGRYEQDRGVEFRSRSSVPSPSPEQELFNSLKPLATMINTTVAASIEDAGHDAIEGVQLNKPRISHNFTPSPLRNVELATEKAHSPQAVTNTYTPSARFEVKPAMTPPSPSPGPRGSATLREALQD